MFKVMAGAVIILMIILGIVVRGYLIERDTRVALTQAAEISKLTLAAKADKEEALQKQKEGYDLLLSEQKEFYNGKTMDLTKRLVTAQRDALQKPVQFGDALWRDLIFNDCVWSLQPSGDRVEGRRACLLASRNANPSSSGLSFSILTPDFLAGWSDACGRWDEIDAIVTPGEEDLAYLREDWDKAFNNFDPKLCTQTLASFTPEGALFLSNFIKNGTAYIEALVTDALENRAAIKILTKPRQEKSE